jgi:hypothetical protein
MFASVRKSWEEGGSMNIPFTDKGRHTHADGDERRHHSLHTRQLRRAVGAAMVASLGATLLGGGVSAASVANRQDRFESLQEAVDAGVLDRSVLTSLEQTGSVEIITKVETSRPPAPVDQGFSPEQLRTFAAEAATSLSEISERGDRSIKKYPHLGALGMTVDSEARLLRLANQRRTAEITAPLTVKLLGTAQSLPLVRQPTAFVGGATGSGQVAAVIDDTGNHGASVAAIVQAMAPQAQVRLYGSPSFSNVAEQFERVLADRAAGVNIRVVNLSWGSQGTYPAGQCSQGWESYLQRISDAGILIVAATGNDASSSGLVSPGCSPRVIGVGAVYDSNVGQVGWSGCTDWTTAADMVTCFSNSNADLDILAPGAMFTVGGQSTGGTSLASPHVAGAIAAIASTFPSANPTLLRASVLNSTVQIRDPRNGIVRPRLDIETARATLQFLRLLPTSNGGTMVRGVPSGRCLDVPSSSVSNGTSLHLWDCANTPNQQWVYNNGRLQVYGNWTKCLDADNSAGGGNGSKVQLWDCTNATNQSWVALADGSFRSVAFGKCLDAIGGSTTNGTKLQIWDCNGYPQQKWIGTPNPNNGGRIQGTQSNRCLDVENSSISPGANVQLWDCTGVPQQQWLLEGTQLRVYGDKCLDVESAGTTNGSRVKTWYCTGVPQQQWRFYSDGTIRSTLSGKCLDAIGGSTTNGTKLQIWDCNGYPQQKWRR